MKAPHGRSWTHYCAGLLLNVIAFAGLGPIIGYAAFGIVFSLVTPFAPSQPPYARDFANVPMSIVLFFAMAPWGIIFAYVLGLLPAAVTGLYVGLASSWLGENALWGSGVVVGAAASAMMLPRGSAFRGSPDLVLSAAIVIAGAVAAAALIRMTRRLRLRQPLQEAR